MKRSIIYLVIALVCGITAISCRRTSHNGAIDGQWKLVSVEEFANDSTILRDTVIYPEREYIDIQLEIMQLRGENHPLYTGVITYDKGNDILTVDFRSPKQITPLVKHLFGVWRNPVTYKVENPDRKTMILRTPECVLTCHRF